MHEENTLRQFSLKPSSYHHDVTPTTVIQTDGEQIVCEVDVIKQEPSDEDVICLFCPGNKDVPVYHMVDSSLLPMIARIESMLMARPGMTGMTQQPDGVNAPSSIDHP